VKCRDYVRILSCLAVAIDVVSSVMQQYPEPVQDMPARNPKLLERVRLVMRARHMSPRTERAYVGWIRRYVRYHGLRHPSELGERGVVAFVTHLAAAQRVARSTQIQALSALLLLYRDVLREPIGDVRSVIRSSAPARLPTVLS